MVPPVEIVVHANQRREEREYARGNRPSDPGRFFGVVYPLLLDVYFLLFALLLLQQAMYLEPVAAAAVSRTAFRHADHQAFSQSASLARCPVLLVDDAFAVVFTLGYGVQVVVGTSKKTL